MPKAEIISDHAFSSCTSLTKLILGGENVTISSINFIIGASNIDLYLSATEMQSGSVNGKQWTKSGKTWTFKSIRKIVP